MSDPTNPEPAERQTPGSPDQPIIPPAEAGAPAGDSSTATAANAGTAEAAKADPKAVGASGKEASTAAEPKRTVPARAAGKSRRSPWLTVGAVAAVLVVLAGLGYFVGIGPMSRLNTTRDIEPPAKLAGLNRITDPAVRNQLQLDATREALSRINNGKKATVEAYGDPTGKRLFVVIVLRGKVDIDKTVRDSGASPEQVKKVGKSTCVAPENNLPIQCYRGSNTLTVIAQAANDGVGVDAVGPVSDEAFDAMR
jgi:hypothetical protein